MGRIRKIGSAHCNYSQILYQFLTFTQNLKRSLTECWKDKFMEHLVSIVVPVYNAERYLCTSIHALQKQDYSNIEIILVDDGSKDASPSICDSFEKEDKRIRAIHKTNGGVSSARNAGIEAATGKYIMFVDSDDLCESNIVSRMVFLAEHWNVNFVICGFRTVND